MRYFVTRNLVKASYAERAIKSIKGPLVRYITRHQSHSWVDHLADITHSYNNTYHRSIKQTPQSVKSQDSVTLWQLQYNTLSKPVCKKSLPQITRFRFKVGDLVRVLHLRRAFQREYDERWSRRLFVVNQRFMTEYIPQYRLKDYAREEILGAYYQNQLKKAFEQDTYLVEKVLKSTKRGRQKWYLVRWKGWPPKYDTWLSEEDFKSLNLANFAS